METPTAPHGIFDVENPCDFGGAGRHGGHHHSQRATPLPRCASSIQPAAASSARAASISVATRSALARHLSQCATCLRRSITTAGSHQGILDDFVSRRGARYVRSMPAIQCMQCGAWGWEHAAPCPRCGHRAAPASRPWMPYFIVAAVLCGVAIIATLGFALVLHARVDWADSYALQTAAKRVTDSIATRAETEARACAFLSSRAADDAHRRSDRREATVPMSAAERAEAAGAAGGSAGGVSLVSLLDGEHQGERVRTSGFVQSVSEPAKFGWGHVRYVTLAERNELGPVIVCNMQRVGNAPANGARIGVIGTVRGRVLNDCVRD
jgi:hypothetical protein